MIVGITGLTSADNPVPGFGVARALRSCARSGLVLVGLAYDPLETALYEEGLLDRGHHIPSPVREPEAFLARLADIKAEAGLDLLIPNLDDEIPALCALAPALKRLGVATFLPKVQALDMLEKQNLPRWTARKGVRLAHPHTRVVAEAAELAELAPEHLAYPVVVKGTRRGARVVYSAPELRLAVARVLAKDQRPAIVQDFVSGEAYSIAALADAEYRIRGLLPLKKLLVSSTGASWMGFTVADEAFLDIASRAAQALKWVGPMDIELLRKDQDEYQLIEINPRFPGWISFSAEAGPNLPAMLLDLVQERDPGPLTPPPGGLMFVRRAVDIVTDINTFGLFSLSGEMRHD
jgi:carbamoyl-phosphate synthase large subunit